ncbi:MAG: hypothetical protein J6A52_05570 [Bacilli bacterium]|nr:hypothetical protein [Bacilli bacterium]
MFNLNNRGWGFVMFLAFLCILLFAILMIVYMANEFSDSFSSRKESTLVSEDYKNYKKYENIVKKAANSSANGKYNINIDDLDISDIIKKQCDGYVLYNSNTNSYVPYLKCGNYMSAGYKE